MQSIVYACVAAIIIAVAVAVVMYFVQQPPGAAFALSGSVRL